MTAFSGAVRSPIKEQQMYEEKPLAEYLSSMFEEVQPIDFYRELFPVGSFERFEHPEDKKPNGILTSISLTKTYKKKLKSGKVVDEPSRHNNIIFDDLLIIADEVKRENDFIIISPVSYYGRNRTAKQASDLFAIVFDIDYIIRDKTGDPIGLRDLIHQMENNRHAKPTYIVASGRGLHLYYLLKEPIHLNEYNIEELNKMRKEMTRMLWNGYITEHYEKPEYENTLQGFRAVGSITKTGTRCRAFLYGDCVRRYDIDELNSYLPYPETHAHLSRTYKRKKNQISYEEAEKKFPNWAETHPKGVYMPRTQTGTNKRGFYDRYFERLANEITVGHRYKAIKHLCACARKVGIPYEEVEKDALSLLEIFDTKGKGQNPFTEYDLYKALETYFDPNAPFYTREYAEFETGLKFKETKRNGRSREKHLAGARAIRDINNDNWREGNGRKPQHKEAVEQYFKEHPEATVTDCASDLDIARSTVYRWKPKESEK